ncbi:glycosyl hydrolase family 28-related protein [Paenibacillus hodogayensis]|uniref:Glycosyl hydrolase family 28-related protein n=1 Tax=Paenibacillus hodogayensis TaxID=279208 RepID=A0ABV5W8R5_9BACL
MDHEKGQQVEPGQSADSATGGQSGQMRKEAIGAKPISRRKLLASLGVSGVAFMSGGMVTNTFGQQTVTGAVYDEASSADDIYYRLNASLTERSVGDKLRESVSVKDFGAVGDGIVNDTAALQAAVDYMRSVGGGSIYFPVGVYRATGVRLYSFITLRGPGHNMWGFSTRGKSAVIKSWDEGDIFYSTGDTIENVTFEGVTLVGLQPTGTKNTQGIVLHNSIGVIINGCDFFLFKNEAVWQKAGGTLRMNNCKIFGGSRRGTSFAERTGAVRLSGHDNMIANTEIGADYSGDSTNLWNCAVKLEKASANMFVNCVFEGADIGIYVAGPDNNFVNCRADINYGHGWWFSRELPSHVPPRRNRLSNCWGHRNSRYESNTFDNFRIEPGQSITGIQMTNCKSSANASNDKWAHRYGLYDGAGDTLVIGYRDDEAMTKWFDGISGYAGPQCSFNQQVFVPASGTTDPDVTARAIIRFNNAAPTTVTGFANGVNGQTLDVLSINANTSIEHNAAIKTNTLATKVLVAFTLYRFKNILGTWYETN